MNSMFVRDPFPGRPRILFIGLPQSSHTRSWIDLLSGGELNVRLFGLPTGAPPRDMEVMTYVSLPGSTSCRGGHQQSLYLPGRAGSLQKKIARHLGRSPDERRLAAVIRAWRPDVIHTLGLEPASYFYLEARRMFRLEGIGKWLVQVRGGPDLTLNRLLPDYAVKIQAVFRECDQVIADNELNYRYALELGLDTGKVSPLGAVPGTGGIDLRAVDAESLITPSRRGRIILWPKAYESPASKALPVFAALEEAWPQITPCRVVMTAANAETLRWFQALPAPIRAASVISQRIERRAIFSQLAAARVLLAPSLVDGVPNILYEAMAWGAFPVVSPLETILPVVREEENVLFARNLFPGEIAAALVRAMGDNGLVDGAARRNFERVHVLADRDSVRAKVIAYYRELAKQ